MKHAWVTTNLLDLWAEPKFNSERVSQLFFSDLLKIDKEKNGYFFVSQPDGYHGWADKCFIGHITSKDYNNYRKKINSILISLKAPLFTESQNTENPHLLFYGTRLWTRCYNNTTCKIILPNKNSVYVKRNHLVPINNKMVQKPAGSKILSEARKFLGVPYLWGGVTTCGFDCSGFVRTIFSRFGINLPRDTKDQILFGDEVSRKAIKTGDLVFFKRHVGIAIGKNRLIHASLGGNGIRINSFDGEGPDFREDLYLNFKTARRVL